MREDLVVFADSFLVGHLHGHLGSRVRLVTAAEDRVMLNVGEAEDIIEAGLVGGVEVANDGGGVGLRRRLRGGEKRGHQYQRCEISSRSTIQGFTSRSTYASKMRAVEIIVLCTGIRSK